MSLISVIVPVYNAEKYLEECIQSILQQSYINWELILVDDGSVDNSLEICKKAASLDCRICVLHQNREGVTAARRKGLEYSQGEYICFVDADDLMLDNALERLIEKMTDNVDVVISEANTDKVITGKELVNRWLRVRLHVELWGKLYRRKILFSSGALNIRKDITIGEDYLGNIKIALQARYIACLSTSVYIYRNNPNSVTRTRVYSLEVEEIFRNEVKEILGLEIDKYEESWYKFQLHMLDNIINRKIKFSYQTPWIKTLLKSNPKYILSMREYMVKSIKNAFICRCIFTLVHWMRKISNRNLL